MKKEIRLKNFFARTKLNKTTGCLEINKTFHKGGYAEVMENRVRFLAHRWIWKTIYGEIPKGLCICHKCDNPKCVNIEHLFLGTHKNNMEDMSKKFRSARNGAKLTPEQVKQVYNSQGSLVNIGKEFKIGYKQVWKIKTKRQWQDILC